jgi:dimethylsulfone monooxygenase
MTSTTSREDQLRESKNPLYNDRALKLGTFSTNLSGGCSMSTIDGVLEATWDQTTELARMGDEMEFEALVPVGRWRGFGGATDFNGAGFECFTWAAGQAAQTEKAGIFVTSHVPTIHPIMAAKQLTTIDHIADGRVALNVVTGWNAPEIEMFGAPLLPHDERYAVAQEWIDILRAVWTSDEPYSFEGKYYQVKDALLRPKPVQQPYPALMNAGSSPAGRHFGARNCDVVFISVDIGQRTPEGMADKIAQFKQLARDEYQREIQVWVNAYIVEGDTEKDAQDYLDYYANTRGDWEAATNLVTGMIGTGNSESYAKETMDQMKFHFIAGWGGYPIVGSQAQVVDQLTGLSKTGLDGVLLSFPRYIEDMRKFQQSTYPLLVEAGLR